MKKAILDILNFYNNKKLGEYSAQASYYIILSFFPFIILLLSLIRLFPFKQTESIELLNSIHFFEELLSNEPAELSIFTAAITLWSVSKSVLSLIRGLNNMLDCKETRGFIVTRIYAIINTILLLLMFAASILIVVFGKSIANFTPVFCIITIFIMLMYKMLPNQKNKLLSQFPGAIFCTICWYIFTKLFEIYAKNSINYYIIYGSLTTTIFAIIWIYVCIQIFYIGAGINLFYIRNFSSYKNSSRIKK